MQQANAFQLAGTAQRIDVDWAQPSSFNGFCQPLLGALIALCDEHIQGLIVNLPGYERTREVVLKALMTLAP